MQELKIELKNVFFLVWDNIWTIWFVQILFVVCSLPLVTIPAAFAGLFYTMNDLANREPTTWRTFLTGMKRHFWTGYRWASINLLVVGILIFDSLFFYLNQAKFGEVGGLLLAGIPIGGLIIWIMLNIYTFPFMLSQEKPSFLKALRNSNFLYVKWPGYSLVFSVLILVILGLSIWSLILLFFIAVSLPALLSCICIQIKFRDEEVSSGIKNS